MANMKLNSTKAFKNLLPGAPGAVKRTIHFSTLPAVMMTPVFALRREDGGFSFETGTGVLLFEIARHVEGLFAAIPHPCLLYHNLDHTRLVVQHATEMARHYSLDNKSVFIVLAAAWFHDTGHLSGNMEEHEERSVQIMKEYLATKSIDKKTIQEIALCILATKMPTKPSSLLEQIICDADSFHIGTADFFHLDNLVWQELEIRLNKPIDNQVQQSLLFLTNHRFFTNYCQELLLEGKEKNILQLKALLES